MKIEARQIDRVLDDSGSWQGLLLYGEDTGLVRERAAKAARKIVDDFNDPFRLTRLEGEEQIRVEEEMSALSLVGGRRVVWVSGVQDNLVPQLERVVALKSDTVLIMEAGSLSPRSKLRNFAEKEPKIASIACYAEEGRALSRTISETLLQDNIRIDREALMWLQSRLASDRALVRNELEKLRLYAVPGSALSLDDVRHCVGDSGNASLEDAVYQALAGEFRQADLSLIRALADGAVPVAYARTVLNIIDKLHYVLLLEQEGQSRQEAIAGLRPPLFFRRKEFFQKALARLNLRMVTIIASESQELETRCKQTGAPDYLLCQRHLMRIAKLK
ncbi:DNA polymerase III subunit delta [Aristophania vespae]|uniref:DNA polymerase III subunit delta n=1 Tax=Aristophania vespae TaxID=2697033 RepID=UPI0023519CBE|nr:DNA polymerase III subunit delta [Aristophania vespae]UMM63659.1 hypothetical protein DM15PD_06330 [Aristophania vespae]